MKTNDSKDQGREAFEAKFGSSSGATWNGTEYVVLAGWEDSALCDRYVAQWMGWSLGWQAALATSASALARDEASVTLDRDALVNLVKGMEVSVDVSTGYHDAGNRIFGTVTEVMDGEGLKHGVILLVQSDIERNFEVEADTTAGAQDGDPLYARAVANAAESVCIDEAKSTNGEQS